MALIAPVVIRPLARVAFEPANGPIAFQIVEQTQKAEAGGCDQEEQFDHRVLGACQCRAAAKIDDARNNERQPAGCWDLALLKIGPHEALGIPAHEPSSCGCAEAECDRDCD